MSAPHLNIVRLRTTCDRLVASGADATTARIAIVQVWALGASAGGDLLDDLVAVAVAAGVQRGQELTAPELLEAYGHPERAERIRNAVDAGRAAWMDATARLVRVHDVVAARELAHV